MQNQAKTSQNALSEIVKEIWYEHCKDNNNDLYTNNNN